MPRTKQKICTVSGIKTSENNFYKNQNHVKAVDNLRRTSSATEPKKKRILSPTSTWQIVFGTHAEIEK